MPDAFLLSCRRPDPMSALFPESRHHSVSSSALSSSEAGSVKPSAFGNLLAAE
jgi:hypothetical protein